MASSLSNYQVHHAASGRAPALDVAISTLGRLVDFFNDKGIADLIPIYSNTTRGVVPGQYAAQMDKLIIEFSKAALADPEVLAGLLTYLKGQDETTRKVAVLYLLDRAVVHREPFFSHVTEDQATWLLEQFVSAKDKGVKRFAARALMVSRKGLGHDQILNEFVDSLARETDLPSVRIAIQALGAATRNQLALTYLSQIALQYPPTPNHALLQTDAMLLLSEMGHKNETSAITALNLLERNDPKLAVMATALFFRPVDPIDGSPIDLSVNNPLAMRFVGKLADIFSRTTDQGVLRRIVYRVPDFDGPQAVELSSMILASEVVTSEEKVGLLQRLDTRMNPECTRPFKYCAPQYADLIGAIARDHDTPPKVAVAAYGFLCNRAITKVSVNTSLAQAEFDGLLMRIRGDGRQAVNELEDYFNERAKAAGLLAGSTR